MTHVFALRPLGLSLATEDGIVPAALAEAMTDADLILQQAKAQAEAILADAAAALEAEKQRGHAEGLRLAEAEAAAWLYQTRLELDARLDRIQLDLADIVTACVKRIVLSFDNQQLAFDTVRCAMASLRSESRLQLFVAPQVEPTIRAQLPALMAEYPEIQLIDLIADPSLNPPDVRLESELGTVTSIFEDTIADLGRLLRGMQARV
jgi:type III secretion protein L